METITTDFHTALDEWITQLQHRMTTYFQTYYQNLEPPEIYAEVGRTWIRIVRGERNRTQCSAFAFVALNDGQNKQLGVWKRGDIHMSASWQKPAKHGRGNIFDAYNGMRYVTPDVHIAYM